MAPKEEFCHSGASSPESLLLGTKITEVPELWRAANPETYIHAAVPPFFIQHGTKDDTVPHQQSVNFAAKVKDICGYQRVCLELIEDARHGDPKFETESNITKVLGFIDQHLK